MGVGGGWQNGLIVTSTKVGISDTPYPLQKKKYLTLVELLNPEMAQLPNIGHMTTFII